MRDIGITKRSEDGTAVFSIKHARIITGVDILVDKVSRAIFNKNKKATYFEYFGLDISSFANNGVDAASLSSLKLSITSSLKNVEQAIIRGTPQYAPMSERLDKVILENIFYDSTTKNVFMKIRIYPKAGSVQMMTYPLDDRKW